MKMMLMPWIPCSIYSCASGCATTYCLHVFLPTLLACLLLFCLHVHDATADYVIISRRPALHSTHMPCTSALKYTRK